MRKPRSNGFVLVWAIVAMTALMAMASLAVDYANVQMVKTQLRRTADAAARYAARQLNLNAALDAAQASAAEQIVNGIPYPVQAGDVATGNWTGSTFTAGGSPLNAVKISISCDAAHGNRVPLMFGRVLGKSFCNVTASAIATYTSNPDGAFVGYSSVTIQNNALITSFNSTIDNNPNQTNYKLNGMVASNGPVTGANNSVIKGGVTLGPSGSVNFPYTGTKLIQTLTPPTLPAWSPGTNPAGTPSVYTVIGNATLPGGTYWFTTLNVTGTLNFSGPATVYINGNANISGNFLAYNNLAANLRVYQYGANLFGDSNGNDTDIIADVWAPNATLTAKNNLTFQGRGFFNVITIKNNANLYYDETFGDPVGGQTIKTVK